ncbi:hypothetical protein [Antarctobacter jejuensis]|uniref:hypothetical protein n=1 Tax=Antarctobacter jejuensis TaxID=1439938 RepID=UPI003FD50D22
MTRWVFLVLVCLLPSALAAQSVTVRGGEHGAFTRLVLTIPRNAEWEITPDPEARRIALSFAAEGLQFNTSRAFDRIGTERVTGISPTADGKGLDIALACACGAEAYVLQGNMLVIDVSVEYAANTPVSTETIAPGGPSGPRQDSGPSPLIGDLSEVRVGDHAGLGPTRERNALLPLLPSAPASPGPDKSDSGLLADDPEAADGLGRQIAADLAIAATTGLLDPAVQLPHNQPKTADRAPAPSATPPEADKPGELARQLAAGLSGIDHDALQKGHIAVGGDPCEPNSTLALHTWVSSDTDPSRVLADRRGKVFGEFDRIDQAALNDYAKALLYFGFGAEARAILSMAAETPAGAKLSMTYIVDGEPDPAHHFSGNAGCDGYASLWSLLAGVPEPGDPAVDVAAVTRTFESLPKHLRSHLGPTLAENLMEAGYSDAARDVLRRLQRMEGEETDSISLGKARLDLKHGDQKTVGKRLHDLSVSGGPEAAEAIVATIDLAEAADSRVPERIVELSEAFATELRNSEDGEKLWQSYVRSLLVNEAFDAAFAEFETDHGISAETVAAMTQSALRALLEDADDVTFLKIAARFLDKGAFPEQDTLVVDIADRFLSLGLPELAISQLDARASIDTLQAARVLRAKALLAMFRPEDAEIILIGQRGDDIARLRAEARRQMGDHVFAKTLLADLGDTQGAVTSAWLSGDWQDVAQSDGSLAPAAELMRDEPTDAAVTVDRLGAVNALAEGSARSRETLRALLDATVIPDTD